MSYIRTLIETSMPVLLFYKKASHLSNFKYMFMDCVLLQGTMLMEYSHTQGMPGSKEKQKPIQNSLVSSSQSNRGDYSVSQVKTIHDKEVDGLRRINGLAPPRSVPSFMPRQVIICLNQNVKVPQRFYLKKKGLFYSGTW